MLRNLLRPFAYLTIKHQSKWIIDWFYPSILAFISILIIFSLQQFGELSLYGGDGLIKNILGFVQSLPGFYIAALAAIATFNRIDIDKIMPLPAPTTDIRLDGKKIAIELTRRRFLCLMFAFLTAESFIIILLAILAQSIYLPMKTILPQISYMWVSMFYMLFFFLIFWQMVLTSFWGLFYLGDKLHQPDR